MPRILKRPMFRSGGSTNEGIMHGLVDRKGYAEGPTQSEIYAKEYEDIFSKIQPPKPRFNKGQMGLNLVSGKYAGEGLLQNIAGSAEGPYSKWTKADDARGNIDYQTKMLATKMGISRAEAEALAKAKATAAGKTPTLKQGVNTTNQVLFGVQPGKTGYFTTAQLLAAQGLITPVDNRMSFTFDADSNTLTQLPVSEVERKRNNQAKSKMIVGSVNTVRELKNRMISQIHETPTGAVGVVYGVMEGASDQFSQATQALGFNKESLDFDPSKSEELDAYLETKGVTKGAANFAVMKGAVINLAYMLAKIKEPGNPRLSEGDIIRQMTRISFGASRDVFAKGLNEIFEQEVIGARGIITGYGLNPDDYFKPEKNKKKEKEEELKQGEDGTWRFE
tara:strand:- start:659 stop:1834 length:1176 start_codon:yes stop_codon:yes gene_type:complete